MPIKIREWINGQWVYSFKEPKILIGSLLEPSVNNPEGNVSTTYNANNLLKLPPKKRGSPKFRMITQVPSNESPKKKKKIYKEEGKDQIEKTDEE